MPLTPQITLTATLSDFTNVAAGSTANPARLIIDLCGYGLAIPEVPNTCTLTNLHIEKISTGSQITIVFFGNDVITPGPDVTYYMITVVDGDGNIVQSACYRFDGTVTIDLSNAVPIPIVPPAPPDPLPRVLVVASSGGLATFDANLGSQVSLTFLITLTENVVATFANLVAGTPYFVIVDQDGTGGWTFTWPGNVLDGMQVNPTPSGYTKQSFVGTVNGTIGAVAPGVFGP